MGRMYTIAIIGRVLSAANPPLDLCSIKAADQQPFQIHKVKVTQITEAGDAAAEMIRLELTERTGSVTEGSGGTTTTPAPENPGDTAFGGTVRLDDTTQASGGTAVTRGVASFHVATGAEWIFLPKEEKWFLPGLSGTVESHAILELFGGEASDDLKDDITVDVEIEIEEWG